MKYSVLKVSRWPTWLSLLLLTMLAGGIRFCSLSRPDLWYDEAATFHRVTSSYADMLEVLRTDGFVPLHYNLYWLLARKFTLTPGVMRFVPALAGTLMVPAIYFLAMQLVTRRAAMLAAAFVACSAWLVVFSHDAKMYMHFWLFVTVHVGCLLWWMRTGRRIAFWSAVAAGCAMAGLHATGLIILGLDVVLFLAHPRTTWKRSIAFTLALALIAAGPVGYYTHFNRFTDSIQTSWNLSGIQWIEWRNQGHSTAAILADTASSYLFAFNFIPEPVPLGDSPGPSPHRIVLAAKILLAILGFLTVLGLFRWRSKDELRLMPAPLSLFYLTTWILLPCYIMYCASVLDFASPFSVLPGYVWAIAGTLLPILLAFLPFSRRHLMRTLLPVGIPVLICLGIYLSMRGRVPAGSIWMPRYLGIIFPALAIAISALFMRLPRLLRYAAIALLLSANLLQSAAFLFVPSEPPVSIVAKDVWDSRDANGGSYTCVQVRPGFGPPGAGTITNNVGLYYLRLLSNIPVRPIEFRFSSADRITPIHRYTDPTLLSWDIQQAVNCRQLILWIEVDGSTPDAESRLLARLGQGWTRQSFHDYPVRVHWTWAPVYTYRRSVYIKQNS
ncbi:MAG TPA: hypothetical protein VFE58_17175 [Tepidisphaeraceae bacterium]|jgi:4-amino-4-deoxy-L-arabinose transferase-like glycosyltransferase|nr:hypothetical protein [Tepidisphaeraceae bacterium]